MSNHAASPLNNQDSTVEYHTLTSTPSNPVSRSAIEPILALSNQVFNAITQQPQDTEHQRQDQKENTAAEPTHHQSPVEWIRRLNRDGAVLIYASSTTPIADRETEREGEIVGYIFAHPRQTTLPGSLFAQSTSPTTSPTTSTTETEIQTTHIWLAAVSPSHRSSGIFPHLLSLLASYVRDIGGEWLSICTFPSRFPRMYGILKKEGSGWVEIGEVGEKDEGKVLFVRRAGMEDG